MRKESRSGRLWLATKNTSIHLSNGDKAVEIRAFLTGSCLWPCIFVICFMCCCLCISIFIPLSLCGHWFFLFRSFLEVTCQFQWFFSLLLIYFKIILYNVQVLYLPMDTQFLNWSFIKRERVTHWRFHRAFSHKSWPHSVDGIVI